MLAAGPLSAALVCAALAAAPLAAVEVAVGRFGAGAACAGEPVAELPHEDRLEPAELTLEAWVRVEREAWAAPGLRWIAGKNGSTESPGHVGLCLDAGGKLGAAIDVGAGAQLAFSTDRRLSPERWHHVAMTFDGNDLKVYLDGRPAAAAAVNRGRARGDGRWAIGARGDGSAGFTGTIDEVVLWSRALPRAEVVAHAGGERAHAADPGLLARWTFDPEK